MCVIFPLFCWNPGPSPWEPMGGEGARGSMGLLLCGNFLSLLEGPVVHVSKRLAWGPSGFPRLTDFCSFLDSPKLYLNLRAKR